VNSNREYCVAAILDKVLRFGEGRIVKKLSGLANQVNALEDSFEALTDEELREETDRFKERIAQGATLDELLPEAFAAVREASRRTLGQRHFDVQLMGGAALHLGNIAEMKTGEGKTLVATLPAYLNALSGDGVHVVTVNDYLAKYQSELMGRVFRFLGLSTGCILSGQTPAERREQYAKDITYGTNNEFGFDYLRDNMAWSTDDLVQRGHNFAVVDEVDSILIDEARTPLIISGPSSGDANKWYGEFARVVRRLTVDEDYEVDEKKRTVGVLEPGIAKVEDYLGIDNLYESLNTPLIGFLNNAIKAKELFKRDKDYVVIKGEVLIVDEHTGRILAGRRYNEGMHQAIEAKEGVAIKAENQTLATITLQNYFRLYSKLGGMTGTADTEAAEFQGTYKLGVVPIPTNRTMQRIDQPDLIYKSENAKFDAVVEDIVERHAAGQPVLVGTTSVEKSELLAAKLKKQGVPHEVLNASSTSVRRRSSPSPAARALSPSPPTWPVEAPTSCSAATLSSSPSPTSRHGASTPRRPRRSTRPRGPTPSRQRRRPSPTSTTRSPSSAVSTCWAPSATSRVVSTTSCVAAPAVRETRASPASTCRPRTTSCACSAARSPTR
jgi:preprotein translocase subunit SecA